MTWLKNSTPGPVLDGLYHAGDSFPEPKFPHFGAFFYFCAMLSVLRNWL
jgi:hypothetical protein